MYLKGLDTLRAVAALIVVWSHIEIIKEMYGLPTNWFRFFPNAHFSVTLFFVLSGFLITFLLTKEQENTGGISLKKFYMRRVLRIWPLYYLILLLSYFFVSSNVSIRTIVLSLMIFPNVPLALKSKWEGSPQVWSIGVEEQFYMFWPLLFLLLPMRRKSLWLFVFCLGITALPYCLNYINIKTIYNEKLYSFVGKFFYYTKFNCMALGGVLGYSVAKGQRWIKTFYNNTFLVVLSILVSFGIWFGNAKFGRFSDEVYAVFFGLMITGVAMNPRISIDTKVTKFFGKISYGLYMYHWMITIWVVKFLLKYEIENFMMNILVYLLVFGLTTLVSWISYHTFEKYFLDIKKKFEIK